GAKACMNLLTLGNRQTKEFAGAVEIAAVQKMVIGQRVGGDVVGGVCTEVKNARYDTGLELGRPHAAKQCSLQATKKGGSFGSHASHQSIEDDGAIPAEALLADRQEVDEEKESIECRRHEQPPVQRSLLSNWSGNRNATILADGQEKKGREEVGYGAAGH